MRTFIITTLMVFISPVMVAPTTPIDPVEFTIEKTKPIKDYYAFLDAIGHQESGNRYNIVNRFGYMGRFQFGKATLRTIKVKVDKETFLNNPQIQDYAMLKLLCYNKNKLQKYIDEYEGKTINGILVTESGLLAAAHLGGQGSVKKWFRTGKVRKDGNGTKITSYMIRFGGYNLDLE